MGDVDFAPLLQKHGEVTVASLPVKIATKWGKRGFTDEEEERIFLFVKCQGNPPELAAVHCRTTSTTVYSICARVARRLEKLGEGSEQHRRPAVASPIEASKSDSTSRRSA